MSVKNILVAFNGTETSKGALRLATVLARSNDAHLTGLYVHAAPTHYANIGAWLPDDTMAMLLDRQKEHAGTIGTEFSEACLAEGMTDRTEFLIVDGQPNNRFAEFARAYDMVVIGQPKSGFWEDQQQPNPDVVALQSGRPVMIAPRGFEAMSIEGGAVIAWDGKRAAARALSDAMDMLRATSLVTVLHVGDDEGDVRQPGADIMEHLSRHDIKAVLRVEPKAGRSISRVLLDTCKSEGAGFLVMGAYEHSQFSEELIGGVTKDVLVKTRLPVLMSH